jgi:hypothetical protein
MSWAERRWERISESCLWTSVLFGALTLYGIYEGDDWRGVVMTAAPGALVFGLWYFARARCEYLATGDKPPLPIAIASGALAALGLAFLVVTRVAPPPRDDEPRWQTIKIDTAELETVDVPLANGGTVKSLARKQPTSCPDGKELKEIEAPSGGGMIRYCRPVAATPSR